MIQDLKPLRRIVTIDDQEGKSVAIADGPPPDVRIDPARPGFSSARIWVADSSPVRISQYHDTTLAAHTIEPPHEGGHLRIVQSTGKPADYDRSKDPAYKPLGPTRLRPDGVWDRGGQNLFSSPVHKSATVDYGILLDGERTLLLDRGNVVLKPGDAVVQLGNWHGWANVNGGSLMAFVMMGATFDVEPKV